jgi:predicted phage terminase large subunit-like protein
MDLNNEIVAPQEGSQADFLINRCDIVLFGGAAGSGKSHALLMDALQYIEDPDFLAVFFRSTNNQLDLSLWPEAKRMYAQFDCTFREKDKTAIFPSGAKIKFAYMELDKHADGHQGVQYSAIYWDEFTHFNSYQFHYLRSRMRSRAANKSFMKCSMNPDRDHFVYDWVKPYLYEQDEVNEDGTQDFEKMKGCPDRSKCGIPRYFVMKGNDMFSFSSKEELLEAYPNTRDAGIMTYSFIAGTIDDNAILDEIEPAYREQLDNLPRVNRLRLRYGNWDVRPEGSGYFQREWCEIVPMAPANAVRVRSWDLAATLPSDVNPNPDWTAGVRMSKDKNGIYYVEDVKRFRDRPDGVNNQMKEAGQQDGSDVKITVPQDPGSAGKSTALQQVRMLAEQGNYAKIRTTHQNKVTRFAPFSAMAEAGLIKIVEGSWNNIYFSELEAFTGDGKTKDDQVDGSSDAFITLAETKFIGAFTMPHFGQVNPYARRQS